MVLVPPAVFPLPPVPRLKITIEPAAVVVRPTEAAPET
jgi:hypothetical protein